MPENNNRVRENIIGMINDFRTVGYNVTGAPQFIVDEIEIPNDFEVEENQILTTEQDTELALKNELKKRHLTGGERRMYHKPKSDWQESPVGEVCRNAETLVVSDIIGKYVTKK